MKKENESEPKGWILPPVGPPRPFYFGTEVWPGLAKLAEECGELGQIAAKIIAYPDFEIHPDGGNLRERLTEELADVAAISLFLIYNNGLSLSDIDNRLEGKLARFTHWHQELSGKGTTAS